MELGTQVSFYFGVLSTAQTPGARERERHKSSILMSKSVKSKLDRAQESTLQAAQGSRRNTAPYLGKGFAFKEKLGVFPALHFHHRQHMSLQLTWARRWFQRLGRRPLLLCFEYLQLEVYQRSLALHPHGGLWFPFLCENGNGEGFQPTFCAAKVMIHQEKENAPMAQQKKENESIPEVSHRESGI